ncbi:UTP--glucose-1-phosphate uridylyltransferase [Olsenella sp. YH-ols2217]|uniref:UTP--glucose-1-phosphate uridylyltransferase n=1 Tax=Kribbibacterium absianum TaxID=3044210 RepID=A0ABT6ZJ22_9ACTN|nr:MULTISPECIES: UTP--glucose-1-phosphate uridylyltransferase [unclassified Olsenella]MDJ1122612.1 UTP--glucose-1-phosphate uridylyltransferase [Olsenella sp. YH-ols2216]MDJ1129050.1 UTP--glucose-1-phosphate uridylyltransferase [Olsenella sp. YH-ols2217]
MKAVIPAAGLGTRFLPATKCSPKELLPVVDKPVIQYVVEEALEPGCVDGVVIVNSHAKPQIEEYFSPDPSLEAHLLTTGKEAKAAEVRDAADLPVSFAYQDEALGLGHAVLCAADAVGDEPFLVLLGDYFVPDRQMCVRMAEVSRAHGGCSVIAVAPVPHEDVSRYGIVAGDVVPSPDGAARGEEEPGAVLRLTGLVEKPDPDEAPTNLFIVGRYLLTPRVMGLLRTQRPGAGGEIQLTDALQRLLAEEPMYALVVDPREGCDTGTPAAWAGTNARMCLADPELRAGFEEALGGTCTVQ